MTFRFAETAEQAQALYEDKSVDLVWPLTDEEIAEQAEDETKTPIYELGTTSVLFNCAQEVFTDPLVRRAMILAIDRGALAQAAG